jgi:hypothetical protein
MVVMVNSWFNVGLLQSIITDLEVIAIQVVLSTAWEVTVTKHVTLLRKVASAIM